MSSLKVPTLEQGSAARLKAVLSVDGVDVDGAVALRVQDPAGSIYTPSVARIDVGVYYADLEVDLPGQWRYRWTSSSPVSAQEGSFIVRRSQVA